MYLNKVKKVSLLRGPEVIWGQFELEIVLSLNVKTKILIKFDELINNLQ